MESIVIDEINSQRGRGAVPAHNQQLKKEREKKRIQSINSAIDLIDGLLSFQRERKRRRVN